MPSFRSGPGERKERWRWRANGITQRARRSGASRAPKSGMQATVLDSDEGRIPRALLAYGYGEASLAARRLEAEEEAVRVHGRTSSEKRMSAEES